MPRPSRVSRIPWERAALSLGEAPGLEAVRRLPALTLPSLLVAQAAVFAWALASGKIPAVVLVLFRALLTL